MGMDPATLSMIGTMFGSAMSGAFQQPSFQEKHSFEGSSADPTTGLTQVQSSLRDIIGGQADRVSQPVTIQSTLDPSLPTFTGGGLPMPIGVKPGAPATGQPLTIPGIDVGPIRKSIGIGQPGGVVPPGTYRDPSPDAKPVAPPGSAVPRPPGQPPGTSVPKPPPVYPPNGADPPNPQPGNPSGGSHRNATGDPGAALDPTTGLAIPAGLDPHTYGALQLLMHSMQPGQGGRT